MLSALIISFSDLESDPRVNRQIKLLSKYYDTTVVGYKDANVEGVRFIPVRKVKERLLRKVVNVLLLKLKLYSQYYWSLSLVKSTFRKLQGSQYDLIIANNLNALPLAFKLSNSKSKVIFDAHEYFPRLFEDQFDWKYIFQSYVIWQCKTLLLKVDGMMTVCKGIAEEYEKNYGVKSVVIPNTPVFKELSPTSVENDTIKMVYHGNANASRQLELMIDVVNELDDRFCLDFLLVGDKKYIEYLRQKADGIKRIRFLPPVAMEQLTTFTNRYDVGIYLLPPANFNSKMALPNKLFEFIQARLAVVIGPSPEMARIVKKYDCGLVSENFSTQSLVNCLKDMDKEKIIYYKAQSDQAAKHLCFENIAQDMLDMIEQVLED